MTKNELLISCIKAVGRLGDNTIDTSIPIELQDEYFDVTHNVIDIINRGYSRLYDANKMPTKVKEIKDTDTPTKAYQYFSKYDLKASGGFINDLGKIDNIALENYSSGDSTCNVSYRMEGDTTIVVDKLPKNHSYIITYYPKVIRMTPDATGYAEWNNEMPYDDELYDIILNLVKAELMEEENPSMAVYYRNVFEQYLSAKDDTPTDVVRRVRNVYGDIW